MTLQPRRNTLAHFGTPKLFLSDAAGTSKLAHFGAPELLRSDLAATLKLAYFGTPELFLSDVAASAAATICSSRSTTPSLP